MRRTLLGLLATALALPLFGGCEPAPSTKVAPDVKEPDNRNVSGEEILKRKREADARAGG